MRTTAAALFFLIGCFALLTTAANCDNTIWVDAASNATVANGEEGTPFVSLLDASNYLFNNVSATNTSSACIYIVPGTYGENNVGLSWTQLSRLNIYYSNSNNNNTPVIFDCSNTDATTAFNVLNLDFLFGTEEADDDDSNIYFQITSCDNAFSFTGNGDQDELVEHTSFNDVQNAVTADNVKELTVRFSNFTNGLQGVFATSANNQSQYQVENLNFDGIKLPLKATNFTSGLVTSIAISESTTPIEVSGGNLFELEFLTVTNSGVSRFSGSLTFSIHASSFEQTVADENGNGGALNILQSSAYIFDSSFTNCNATNGGAIYYNGGANVTFQSVNFTQCSAEQYGGAIQLEGNITLVQAEDIRFVDNYAGTNGSCISCCNNDQTQCNITVNLEDPDTLVFEGNNSNTTVTCPTQEATVDTPFSYNVSTDDEDSSDYWWILWLVLALLGAAILIAVIAGVGYFIYQKRTRSSYDQV